MTEMKSRADRRNLIALFAILTLIIAVPAMLLHTSHTPDEMGVMANSAYLAGYDWSYGIHLTGDYYYKYGVLLFYTLPYLLLNDSILIFRVLLVINGITIGVTGIACYLICRRYLKIGSPTGSFLISLVCAGTPAALLQSAYSRADFVLVFTPWLILLFLLEATISAGRRKICFSILCAATASYAFMSHTRGLVLVIALFITVVMSRVFFHIYTLHIRAYLCTTAVCLIADRFFTQYFKQAIWKYGTRHASMSGMRFSALKTIVTPAGLKVLIKTIFGWFYTAFSSTMGLVCVGVFASLLFLIYTLRKKKVITDSLLISGLFGTLNLAGSMAMGILFFYPYLYDSFRGTYKIRFDRAFYERYMVGAFGILSLVAIYVLIFRKDLFGIRAKIFSALSFAISIFVFCKYIAVLIPHRNMVNRYVMTLNTFSNFISENAKLMISAGLFALLIFLILLLIFGRKKWGWTPLILMVCIYLCVYTINFKNIRLREDRLKYSPLETVYHKIQSLDVDTERFPYIYFECKNLSIKVRQPLFKDFQMLVGKVYTDDITDLFISTGQSELTAEVFQSGTIYKFADMDYDTEGENKLYVKGDRLRDYLTEKGVKLIACG